MKAPADQGHAPGGTPRTPPLECFFNYAGMAHDSGPGHPEASGRLSALLPLFQRRVKEEKARFLESSPDPDLSLYRSVHEGEYIDFLEGLRPGNPPVPVDGDTQVSHATVSSLREIAGAIRVLSGSRESGRKVFCAVRPPGHHAHSRGGMGFCAVNHVALLCALRVLSSPDERVMILDFDVHHGNGTAEIVARYLPPERVLFVSTHRFPFYPGTGSGKENLELEGGGGSLDIPLPAGTDDRDYRILLEDRILPRWDRFLPGTVLVSAGFDAHADDPLGDMALTEETYESLGRELANRQMGLAAAFLEGGYSLSALSRSVDAFLDGWAGK